MGVSCLGRLVCIVLCLYRVYERAVGVGKYGELTSDGHRETLPRQSQYKQPVRSGFRLLIYTRCLACIRSLEVSGGYCMSAVDLKAPNSTMRTRTIEIFKYPNIQIIQNIRIAKYSNIQIQI